MAIRVPARLKMSFTGSVTPTRWTRLLTGPLSWRSTYQAVVRTSSEVQNGISTSSIRMLASQAGALANM